MAMDIEWAKDGISNKMYIVQARPETIFSHKKHGLIYTYKLKEKGKTPVQGKSSRQKNHQRPRLYHSLPERSR